MESMEAFGVQLIFETSAIKILIGFLI